MKKLRFAFLLLLVMSCQKKMDKAVAKHDSIRTAQDSIAAMDKDEHGCLISAGYVWSVVGNECVKVYSGVPLNPIELPANTDETKCVYVLFSENGKKAELFLPDSTDSVILKEFKPKKWSNQKWYLAFNGQKYDLSKEGNLMYTGDPEMGSKIMGSDVEE